MALFDNFKKKSLIKKIANEFQTNWKEEYFSITDSIGVYKIIEKTIKAVNDYKSGIIDLKNYEIDSTDLTCLKLFRERINRCEKEIQDPVTLEKRKLIINDIVEKFQKKGKEYFNKGIKHGSTEDMFLKEFFFIIENYNNGSYNFPQITLRQFQLISENVHNYIERQDKLEKIKAEKSQLPEDTNLPSL
jgi:hypothetical protein